MEDMTEKELITVLIDKYTDLQRIKRANNGVENQELEYQIKVTKRTGKTTVQAGPGRERARKPTGGLA